MTAAPDLAHHMERVARALFGEPDRRNSKKGELRFGTHGSLSIDLTRGVFFDHERKESGGLLDLVKRETTLTGVDALDWMRSIGCDLGDAPRTTTATNGGGGAPEPQTFATHSRPWKPATTSGRPSGAQISAEVLMNMRFEPIKYVVPGIIVEGLTLLAGKPKMGKSWMMLHAAIAVARGGFTLGEIRCVEGDVLYCALEDNLRRLQSRMTKLLGMQPWPKRLTFQCEMPRLAEGGLDVINKWIRAADHPRFVIIDPLAMVRAPKKREETNYDADYAAAKELRALASEHGIAVVLVHHLRKQDSDDAFDTVSGTLGLTGAPDTVLVVKRDTGGTIVLHGRGRDLVEIEKAMTFNGGACTWTIAGDARIVRMSSERQAILAALAEATEPLSPKDIAEASRMSVGSVKHLLRKMAADGAALKTGYGKYVKAIAHPRE
jgi:hypothetical protein